jgi:hypothetical protein
VGYEMRPGLIIFQTLCDFMFLSSHLLCGKNSKYRVAFMKFLLSESAGIGEYGT